jgi:hypothetical protein
LFKIRIFTLATKFVFTSMVYFYKILFHLPLFTRVGIVRGLASRIA